MGIVPGSFLQSAAQSVCVSLLEGVTGEDRDLLRVRLGFSGVQAGGGGREQVEHDPVSFRLVLRPAQSVVAGG